LQLKYSALVSKSQEERQSYEKKLVEERRQKENAINKQKKVFVVAKCLYGLALSIIILCILQLKVLLFFVCCECCDSFCVWFEFE